MQSLSRLVSRSVSHSVCSPCGTDWRVRLPKLEGQALSGLPALTGRQASLRGTTAKRTGMSVPSNKPSGPAVVDRGQQASRFTPRAGLAGWTGRTFILFLEFNKKPPRHLHDFSNHLPLPRAAFLVICFHLEYQHQYFQVRSIAFCSTFSILLFASDGHRSIDCI